MADIERALSSLGATTGDVLIPEVVDPGIRDYIWKSMPLLQVVTRVPWPTHTYYFRKRDTRPSASWELDEATLPASDTSTFSKQSAAVKFVYARGEVTGPLIAASGGVVNALQEEIRVQSQVIAEELTTKIITGDNGTNPEEFDGFLEQVSASAPGDEGGTTDVSAATLTLAMLDTALDDTRGEANVILTSRVVRRKINSLLQAQQRFNDRTDIGAGFRVLSYDDVPILTDLHWEANDDILFFRSSDAKLLVNQDFSFSPLAKTKDSEDFFIKGYFGFALEGRPVRLTNFSL